MVLIVAVDVFHLNVHEGYQTCLGLASAIMRYYPTHATNNQFQQIMGQDKRYIQTAIINNNLYPNYTISCSCSPLPRCSFNVASDPTTSTFPSPLRNLSDITIGVLLLRLSVLCSVVALRVSSVNMLFCASSRSCGFNCLRRLRKRERI